MVHVRVPRPWEIPTSEAASSSAYLTRRDFVRSLGLGTVGAAAVLAGCRPAGAGREGEESVDPGPLDNVPPAPTEELYPRAPRDPRFAAGPRHGAVTDEVVTATYNNFYEFGTDKEAVWRRVERFRARPWTLEVRGLVRRPGVFDLEALERTLGLEERVYRLRCVEAWSIAVPWIGFPLHRLLERVEPLPTASHVRFVSFHRPDEAPGQAEQDWYPWPYFEGLRMDEAMHELTCMVTGMYGGPLQKQNGAPVRIVVPWKYGFKSPKSVELIEVVDEQPPVFWNRMAPREYGFLSNVDPKTPHPRWSQVEETVVQTGDRVPTLPYNGYGRWVAELYPCPTPPGDVPHARDC